MLNFLPISLCTKSNVGSSLTPTQVPTLNQIHINRPAVESLDLIQSKVKEVMEAWSHVQEECTDSKYQAQLKKLQTHSRFQEKAQRYEECWDKMWSIVLAIELYIYKEKRAEKAQVEVKSIAIEAIQETAADSISLPNNPRKSIFPTFRKFWNTSPKNPPLLVELDVQQDLSVESYDESWDAKTLCIDLIPRAEDVLNTHPTKKLEADFDRVVFTEEFLSQVKPLLSELSQQLETLHHAHTNQKTPFWTQAMNWSMHSFITIGGIFVSLCLSLGVFTSMGIFASIVAVLLSYQRIFKVCEEFDVLYSKYLERPWEPVEKTVCKMEVLLTSLEKLIEQVEIRQNERKQTLHHQHSNAHIEHHFMQTQHLLATAVESMRDCLKRLFYTRISHPVSNFGRIALPPPEFS